MSMLLLFNQQIMNPLGLIGVPMRPLVLRENVDAEINDSETLWVPGSAYVGGQFQIGDSLLYADPNTNIFDIGGKLQVNRIVAHSGTAVTIEEDFIKFVGETQFFKGDKATFDSDSGFLLHWDMFAGTGDIGFASGSSVLQITNNHTLGDITLTPGSGGAINLNGPVNWSSGGWITNLTGPLTITSPNLDTEATGFTGSLLLNGSVTKNDANTRTFNFELIKPTLNTGISNTNTTVNVFEIDTINTAVTGLTTNLMKASYGGTELLRLGSDGYLVVNSGPSSAEGEVQIGALSGTPTYAALYMSLGGNAKAAANYTLTSGGTETYLNHASGGTVGFRINNSNIFTMSSSLITATQQITSSVASGSNAFSMTTGARLKLGSGSGDYFTSDGASTIGAAGSFSVAATATLPVIEITRSGGTARGISWYQSSYNTWFDYMSPSGANMGPHGNITAPSGTLVTNWAMRSLIENISGYGWTWESGPNTGTTPSVVAELSSVTGNFRTIGTIQSSIASGSVAFTTTQGARLNLGNSGRYLWDDGSEFVSTTSMTLTALTANIGGTGNAIRILSSSATSGTTLQDSPKLTINGAYWNGTSSVQYPFSIQHDMTAVTPASKASFQFNSSEVMSLGNDGLLLVTDKIDTIGSSLLQIGTANAASVTLGRSGISTYNLGNFSVQGDIGDYTGSRFLMTTTNQYAFGAYGNPLSVFSFYALGKDLNTANDQVKSTQFLVNLTKNDANLRTLSNFNIQTTLNTGGSNANTTFYGLDIDSTNTGLTGLAYYPLRIGYGGSTVLRVDSAGNILSNGGASFAGNLDATFGTFSTGVSTPNVRYSGDYLRLQDDGSYAVNVTSTDVGARLFVSNYDNGGDAVVQIGDVSNSGYTPQFGLVDDVYNDVASDNAAFRIWRAGSQTIHRHRGSGTQSYVNSDAAHFSWSADGGERMRLEYDGTLRIIFGGKILTDTLDSGNALSLGGTDATAVNIGRIGIDTNVTGSALRISSTLDLIASGTLSIGQTNAANINFGSASNTSTAIGGGTLQLTHGAGQSLNILGNGTGSVVVNIGASATSGNQSIELGQTLNNNSSTYIDFKNQTYSDYAFRLIRGPSNTNSDIIHRGTGPLRHINEDGGQHEWFDAAPSSVGDYSNLLMYLNSTKLGFYPGVYATSGVTTQKSLAIEFDYSWWNGAAQISAGYAMGVEPTSAAAGVGDLVFRYGGTSGTETVRFKPSGDVLIKAGSTSSVRTLSLNDSAGAGNNARFQFTDSGTALQSGFGNRTQLYSYHNLELYGGMGGSIPTFTTGSADGNNIISKSNHLFEGEVRGNKMSRTAQSFDESASHNPSTATGTYANLTTVSYTQDVASQKIVVIASGTCYTNTAGTVLGIRVTYDGSNKTAYPFYFNVANQHLAWSFVWVFTGSGTTGSKTVALEWARTAGAGTIFMDANDSFSIAVL